MKGHIAGCFASGHLIAAAALSALFALPVQAATYTYGLADDVGATGYITTNCDNCVLNGSDITAWSFVSPAAGVNIASTTPGAFIITDGSDMVAKPNAISFDFGFGGDIGFQAGNESADFLSYFTFASGPFMFPQGGGEIDLCSPGNLITGGGSCFGGVFAPAGSYVVATAKRVTAPELDPTSCASGFTLLLGALAVLTGRRRWSATASCA